MLEAFPFKKAWVDTDVNGYLIASPRLVRHKNFRGMSWQVWNEPPKQESRDKGSRQLRLDE